MNINDEEQKSLISKMEPEPSISQSPQLFRPPYADDDADLEDGRPETYSSETDSIDFSESSYNESYSTYSEVDELDEMKKKTIRIYDAKYKISDSEEMKQESKDLKRAAFSSSKKTKIGTQTGA